MNRLKLVRTIVALGLVLALAALAIPARAAAPRFGITGKITRLSLTSLMVKTSSGTITTRLTSSTVILRMEHGSLSDLKPGTFVSLSLGAGSRTVTGVSVSSRLGAFPNRGAARPRTGRPRIPRFGGQLQGGTIVSLGKGRLTVRSRQGTSTTYTLSAHATITKSIRGTLGDLRLGQTVRVGVRPGTTTAFSITIESV
jgi:hypothetical protein